MFYAQVLFVYSDHGVKNRGVDNAVIEIVRNAHGSSHYCSATRLADLTAGQVQPATAGLSQPTAAVNRWQLVGAAAIVVAAVQFLAAVPQSGSGFPADHVAAVATPPAQLVVPSFFPADLRARFLIRLIHPAVAAPAAPIAGAALRLAGYQSATVLFQQ